MGRREVAALAGAGAFALAILAWSWTDRSPTAVAKPPEREVARSAPQALVRLPAGSDESRAAREKSPREEQAAIEVRGEVRLFDWNGARRSVPSGYLHLRQDEKDVVGWLEEGRWKVTLRAGSAHVQRLTLSGLFAVPRQEELEIDGSGVVVLDADVVQGTALRVVDAATGSDLSGVAVVPARSFQDLLLAVPPPEAVEAATIRDAVSPVVLPQQQGSWTFWVGAPPGHVWRSVSLQGGDPGVVRTVALERAGTVVVDLLGTGTGRGRLDVALRAHATPTYDGAALAGRPGGEVRFEGLEPGDYTCRLSHSVTGLLGERRVTVRAGTEERLQWEVLEASQELRGVLRWPLANADIAPRLELHRRRIDGELELVAQKPKTFEPSGPDHLWSFGRRAPGAYVIVVQPILQEIPLEVHAREEVAERAIQGAPAARVRVHPVASGGDLPADLEIHWSRARLPAVAASREEGDGSYAFVCVPGPLEVLWGPAPDAFGLVTRAFDVVEGPNDLTLEVESAPGRTSAESKVALRFHEQGVPVPVDIDPWHPARNGRALSGTGRYLWATGEVTGLSCRFSTLELRFSGPGVFAFEMPRIPGYRELGPLSIEVPGLDTIEVELVPLP